MKREPELTIERMNALADAADGMTTEQAVAYLKHGAETINLLKTIISLGHSLSDKYCKCPDCKNSIAIKELLTKLEGDK